MLPQTIDAWLTAEPAWDEPEPPEDDPDCTACGDFGWVCVGYDADADRTLFTRCKCGAAEEDE